MFRCTIGSLSALFVFVTGAFCFGQATTDAKPKLDEVVTRALDYLRDKGQEADGTLSPRIGSGITSLAVTAALRHDRPLDDPLVARGLKSLEGFVKPDGGIYGTDRLRNYETCVGIVAFSEANKKAGDGRYDEILKNAEKFVRGLQIGATGNADPQDPHYGGVGYGGPERPDLSNTGYLLDALVALNAPADDPAIQRALAFVSRCQNLKGQWNDTKYGPLVDDGGFYYVIPTESVDPSQSERYTANGGLRSYGSMTYAGFKSLVYAGLKKDDPRAKAALKWISKNYSVTKNPGQGTAGLFYYYNVFGNALAASGMEEIITEKDGNRNWRADLLAELAKTQNADGSWTNENGQWFENDPNLSTSFALLASRSATTNRTNQNSPRMSSRQHSAQPIAYRWLRQLSRPTLILIWGINVALLVAGVVWVFGSGHSLRTIELLHSHFGPGNDTTTVIRDPTRMGGGTTAVIVGAAVAAATFLVMFGSLFAGTPRFRTTRLWLVFMAITGGWLGFLVAWQDIYWMGQQLRVKSDLASIAVLAQELKENWPVEDGEYPELGMYLAYPKGAPRTMLLLGDATFPDSSLRVSAIEKSTDGAIRFELSGNERGGWLEWRGNDSPPESFMSGLESKYQIARYDRLAHRWYLVRYHANSR